LNQKSVEFFKRAAKKNKVKYQTMINELLDKYAEKYSDTMDSSEEDTTKTHQKHNYNEP